MAAAIDLTNEVLLAFINSHRNEMTLNELHKILSTRFMRLTTDEVLRIVRSPSLVNLFNLQPISNDLCLIQLSPKLTLCEPCLQKGCKNKMSCTKLHLCRYISHFSNKPIDKPCRFPHKLSDLPNNVVLLRRFNYDILNEDTLLDLLRLHYKNNNNEQAIQSQSGYYRSSTTQSDRNHLKTPKPRPPSQLKKSPNQPTVSPDNVKERQLDISIPSERDAPDVDLEIVQLLLATKDLIIEQTFEKQISNEFYRRYTLQFKSKQVIDNILQNEPIIIYNNIPIKMKRTLRQRDSRIFALKFHTDKKIDTIRLNLYVETLVGKVNPHILDMTADGSNEQIYLIQCEQPIDFIHLYKVHSAKNTLQGHRVTVDEVYEAESLEVLFRPNTLHPSMTMPRLRQLFGENRWKEDVFACVSIRDQNSADIELMNAEIAAKWISESNKIEQDLSLIIHPIIDFIHPIEKNQEDEDDDDEIVKLFPTSSSLSPSNASDDSQKVVDNDPNHYIIKPDWRIVLTHPIFGEEYRKYIREHLNISAQITGSIIQVPNEYIRKELARYTNMFIQTFVFRELVDSDKEQIKLVKDNYSRMAHKWQKNTNKTLVIARPEVMNELFPQFSSTSRQQNKRFNTPTFRNKQSPTIRKQEQQSTPPVTEEPINGSITPQSQSQIKTTEDHFHTLPYSIENSVYFPFFTSSNSFPDRLKNYLSTTFNIELDIKHISSTKLILELKGQHKDCCDARPALTALFASLKTKIYSDSNDCKFAIPDVYRVAQWNLDQCSIVSSCSFSTKNGGTLSIRYFADNPQFGVDEQKIDDIILHILVGASYKASSRSKKLEIRFEELRKQIQQRSDYGQDICCLYNYQKGTTDNSRLPSIYLYGIKSVVQQIYQEIKTINNEYTPIPCNVQLTSNQIDFLFQICSNDLIKFEKEYEADGVDLRSKLKSETNQFLAPKYLHEKIKVLLLELSQIQTVSKDFKCSSEIINKKKSELNDIALQNRCLLSITPSSQPTASSRTTSTTTNSKISSGAINVSNGDLTKEQSEVLVICSTSTKLAEVVIKAAGTQVEQELNGKDPTKNMIDTSSGQLKQAKRLLFLPWTPPQAFLVNQDINSLRQSILVFIQQAIKYAIQGRYKSIAFPAIGCGGFGIPPDIIATIMIDAVRELLTMNPGIQLEVTFVVQQSQVYDVFNAKLKPTSTADASQTRSSFPPHSYSQETNLTLTTFNANIDAAKSVLKIYDNILTSSYSD